MPLEGSAAIGTQHLAKPGIGERQHFKGEPQGRGRSTSPAALERDLAEVQLIGAEVGVGGIVDVEPPDARIGEEDGAAAVGLEAVLMGVDDDAVDA